MKGLIVKHIEKELKELKVKLGKEEIEKLIEIPPSPEFGDYAFPCFVFVKELKKSSNEIAKNLAERIVKDDFEKVEARGAYVNFFLDREVLANRILKEIVEEKDDYGKENRKKKKIMIEFSQANTHKAFHVGHIRGTSLGESLSRILEFYGYEIIRANYEGDKGMHVAKWIWCYQKFHGEERLIENETWIANVYIDAVKRLTENPELEKEVEEINRKLETREDKTLNELWEKTRNLSLNSFEKIYQELNAKFDVYFFESEMEEKGKKIVDKIFNKRVAHLSDGALIVNLEEHGLGIWVLLRKDGTILYSAKDLALAEIKFKKFKIDKAIYVVGAQQRLHFMQLFKTLELMKFKSKDKLIYVPVSEVRFPWGKMSSRTGENILYSDFKNELIEYAKKEIEEREKIGKDELEKRALRIAIAAMKYSMLKQDTDKPIIFVKEEAMKFEGNTGPYLLYSYARARSILRKSVGGNREISFEKIHDIEKNLISGLGRFPEIVEQAGKTLQPALIANYCYEISKKFNEFYHLHKVIGSENVGFRLLLVRGFTQVLKNGLNLLGIDVLEKM